MHNRDHDLRDPSFAELRWRWRERAGAVPSYVEQSALPFALPSRDHWPGRLESSGQAQARF